MSIQESESSLLTAIKKAKTIGEARRASRQALEAGLPQARVQRETKDQRHYLRIMNGDHYHEADRPLSW